jgi:hypothetical protein
LKYKVVCFEHLKSWHRNRWCGSTTSPFITMLRLSLPLIALGGALLPFASSSAAAAASFNSFSFTTHRTASPSTGPTVVNDPTRDIRLDAVTTANGTTYRLFEVVTGAKILENDPYTAANGQTYGILNSGRISLPAWAI